MAHTRFLLRFAGSAAMAGHAQGLAQPCLRLLVSFDPVTPAQASAVKNLDDAGLMPMPDDRHARLSDALLRNRDLAEVAADLLSCFEPLNQLLVRLQESAGCPVCSGAIIEQLGRNKEINGGWSAVVVMPSLSPARLAAVVPFAVAQLAGKSEGKMMALADAPNTVSAAIAWLGRIAPRGVNTRLFLAAAYQLGVPVQRLAGQTMQYGWGAQARWMDSSFTDAASGIAARLARDKVAAHQVLRRAGLPVAEQIKVNTVADALQHAERMGYPVVMKPADLDGGKGVEAGLKTPEALQRAFERANKYSKNLILERHIEGEDYRLGVLYGGLSWVIYREPAGVWGDGQSSVNSLIEAANCDPRRGTQSWAQMVPLTINEEAEELLAEQGVALTNIVAVGRFVRLRRAANTSSGGIPRDVFENVHPDNAALAEQVARLFRLDVAGIDFICPDISRSWRDVGGVVCEVNAQPQFSLTRPDTPVAAITGLVKARGRIPVVVIVAELAWGEWANTLHTFLRAKGLNAALSLADGLWLSGQQYNQQRRSAFADVQAMQLNTDVQAMVIATDGKAWLNSGVPLDRVDLVVSDKYSDARVMAMLAAAGQPTCWRASQPMLAASTNAPNGLQRLGQMIAEQISCPAEASVT